jgi:diaminohydroxyphosphoribosylaminopyrimidine deaminase/5-amino-6-(5-phosphoribosylamino)uracil reductase
MCTMSERDDHYLRMAARLALRGHGGAEPNPLVGSVIVAPNGQVIGWGYHRRCGGPHAEIIALRRAGNLASGATLYCTLEPCNHTGRTPPCVDSIIEARIKRIVIARRDPNPIAGGGLERLRAAGIEAAVNEGCEQAIAVSEPFAYRVRSGLPWVTAKWAQTLDGKIATRSPHGESQWISSEASRRMVHRERGRVDAILTGIGTLLKDDPMLTARGVRVRRIARRVVIDPRLRTPLDSKIISTAHVAPITIVFSKTAVQAEIEPAKGFKDLGVELLDWEAPADELPLGPVLRELTAHHDLTNVLVEAGSGLLSRLFRQKLVNEAWVFVGPMLLGDDQAASAVAGMNVQRLSEGAKLKLLELRRRGCDVIARYRVHRSSAPSQDYRP